MNIHNLLMQPWLLLLATLGTMVVIRFLFLKNPLHNLKESLLSTASMIMVASSFYILWNWYNAPKPEVGFVAPASKLEQEPLRLEVDFKNNERETKEELATITTKQGIYTFSNYGATLNELIIVRDIDGEQQKFIILGNPPALERSTQAFLVAFDSETPYFYACKGIKEQSDIYTISYTAHTDQVSVEKLFTIYKDRHQLDLTLTVTPHQGNEVRPRIMWPSPHLKVVEEEVVLNAILIDKAGAFVKKPAAKLNGREGYFSPELFGGQDKYFIMSMVKDKEHFAARAYYQSINNQLLSFIEATPVAQTTTWTVAFYVGPRELSSITPVAVSLEKTLDYGFFSPIARLMLHLLNLCNKYVHNYGVAILLITLLLKVVLLPFTISGAQKMKKMKDYQKKLAYINQKYRNDPEALAQAREELFRTHGLGGLSGCLPLLIQIPFFFGLQSALNNAIELYHAPFAFWIKDLSAPDPYYVLPFLVAIGAIMGSIFANSEKPGFRQVLISFMFALLIGSFTINLAAGLSLFMTANIFLHVIQTRMQQAFE